MSEQRLIDANALQEKLKCYFGVRDGVLLHTDAYAILSAIDEAPTITIINNTFEQEEVMPNDNRNQSL